MSRGPGRESRRASTPRLVRAGVVGGAHAQIKVGLVDVLARGSERVGRWPPAREQRVSRRRAGSDRRPRRAAVDRALMILQSGETDAALTLAKAELPTVEAEIERLTAGKRADRRACSPDRGCQGSSSARRGAQGDSRKSDRLTTPTPSDWKAVRTSMRARARGGDH